jgi:hypothetical protein
MACNGVTSEQKQQGFAQAALRTFLVADAANIRSLVWTFRLAVAFLTASVASSAK